MKRLSEIRDFNSYHNTENDRTIPARSPEPTHFNSRSLCRKRQLFVSVKVWYPIFQSTFPMQGTTSMRLISKTICLQFQSTFPMQGTTSDMQRLLRHKQFQSTFPMQGTTVRAPSERVQRPDFNPRSQCRERRPERTALSAAMYFNPRSQCRERLLRLVIMFCPSNFNPRSQCRERPYSIRNRVLQH